MITEWGAMYEEMEQDIDTFGACFLKVTRGRGRSFGGLRFVRLDPSSVSIYPLEPNTPKLSVRIAREGCNAYGGCLDVAKCTLRCKRIENAQEMESRYE